MEIDIYTKRYRSRVRKAAQFAGVQKGDRVLDVGVGRFGVSSKALSSLGAKVTSLDNDPNKAGLIDRSAKFVHGDIRKTKFDDKEFNIASAVLVLHELTGLGNVKAIMEMARIADMVLIIEKTPAITDVRADYELAWQTAMRSIGRVEEVRPPLYWFKRIDGLEPKAIRSRFIKERFPEEPGHFQARILDTKEYWKEQNVPKLVIEKLDMIPLLEPVEVPPLYVIAADL